MCGAYVQATPQAVPADIGKDNSSQPQGPHLDGKVRGQDSTVICPSNHIHESIAGVDSNRDSFYSKFMQSLYDHFRLSDRDRAQHYPSYTQIDGALNIIHRTQSSTKLD